MIEDAELLRRYAEHRSQEAFAELVRRRVNLVYSVALRQVGGDAHLAEDVTQKVFAALARKAGSLHKRAVLTGWLFRSAQFAATDVVRSERRRRAREQETLIMDETTSNVSEEVNWDNVRPMLDEVMGELNDADRDAVALRFFEERPFAAIGDALGLTEEAARKRVMRALDKLHGLLTRRGVTSTSTAALALALANQGAVAAPASVVSSITASAVALAGSSGAAGAGLLIFMTSAKTIVGVTAVIAVAAAVTAFCKSNKMSGAQEASQAAVQQPAELTTKVDRLQVQIDTAQKNVEADGAEALEVGNAPRTPDSSPPPTMTAVGPVTKEMVENRYHHGRELVRSGDFTGALAEFLWCYDEGMLSVQSYVGVRNSFLTSAIWQLGEKYPPALEALRQRRDQAAQQIQKSEKDLQAAEDFAALNRALKEDARTLEVYDRLPANDVRRKILLLNTYNFLVATQRYVEAAQALSFPQMDAQFQRSTQESAGTSERKGLREARHRSAATLTTKNIEVLAGAGDLVHARELIQKLLAFDNSDQTKNLLQTHLTRAGHVELLTPPPKL